MKFETLSRAYKRLTKKKYTTRADLARNCDFSLVTAGAVARELIGLGIVFEKKIGRTGKLSAHDINYSIVTADMNRLYLITADKSLKKINTDTAIRNYSFPLIEDISIFLRGRYFADERFPCLFLHNVPENEIEIFSDLLPKYHAVIPAECENALTYARDYMLASKIKQKALANKEKV